MKEIINKNLKLNEILKYYQLDNPNLLKDKKKGSAELRGLKIQVNQYKNKLICSVCSTNEKNCMLAKCTHMFCRSCIQDNINNRNRKCPQCKLAFSKQDVKAIYF